ncbi:hypothetical protein B0H14DRAFT_3539393 [Mycena olivaceomarginata]|nr:hypothetical protein B0H14DRAFT_3539393 [Mycena olivaceomarginata]
MQCRQTRRFGVLCGSLRRLFLSSLFSLLIFFLLDPSFRLPPRTACAGPLYLFESVINSLWFLRTSVILFLNKIDVFKRNIVSRPSSSPRANNVNIAGARRGARSGDCAGDECCGIQHAVLAPRPTRARSVSSRLGLCLFWPRWGRWGAENASSARWSESYPCHARSTTPGVHLRVHPGCTLGCTPG